MMTENAAVELADRVLAALEVDDEIARVETAGARWPDRAWWNGVAEDAAAAGASALTMLADAAGRLSGPPPASLRAQILDVARIVCANERQVAGGRPSAAVFVIVSALAEHVDHVTAGPSR